METSMSGDSTKARTKGAKRRGRPPKDGPREPSGRLSRIPSERRDDAQSVVIEARAKAMGVPKPDGDHVAVSAWRRRLLADHMGCEAGRAIDGESDRAELWAAIKAIASAHRAYWQAIAAPYPYPRILALETEAEAPSGGVEVSAKADIRTPEERVRTAVNRMMHIETVLGAAGEGVAAVVKETVLHDRPVRCRRRYLAGLRAVVSDGELG